MEKALFLKWLSEGTVSIPHVLFKQYRAIGLQDEECMLILHVHTFIESGNPFPTPEELSGRMSISAARCMALLRSFIQQGLLEIDHFEDGEKGMYYEAYSLNPLWEKLLSLLSNQEAEQDQQEKENDEENVYSIFEREFGRPLSPMECETLKIWIDQDRHSPALIISALKEAVISGKLNFRYIDRILFEWKKNNIQTPEQARTYGEKFRARQTRGTARAPEQSESHNQFSVPVYNWLEQS
ncbi:DnaD domain-containing protein [Fictibacillus sp. KIGAM418]|uniref:DnaD domain-containing protein n=1 Tax=Fictibacillus marinisediminis TaxID=2878389 RepID=A0A9X1XCV7_9BACL|nr:DnaD domain-containing protein [Fictibacillus marinisediminis]MCK6257480.1 DnaD domain-containing protein [Fictibacillus marinisediminis]